MIETNQAIARKKNVRCSAQKMRLVVNMIRGKNVEASLDILRFCNKQAAVEVRKTLISAISNAEENHNMDIDDLYVNFIMVDEGPTMKRWRARAKGRSARINKRTCHLTVGVAEHEV